MKFVKCMLLGGSILAANIGYAGDAAVLDKDFSSMSCDQIKSTFKSYDEKKDLLSAGLELFSAFGGSSASKVADTAKSADNIRAKAKKTANAAMVVKGCTDRIQ